MLSRQQRLTRPAFAQVYKAGRRIHTKNLTGILIPASTQKAAVVVSKKVAKKAHERNKIRRRLYALLRGEWKEKKPLSWCVFITKPSLARLTSRQFTTEIKKEIAHILNSQ